MKKGLALALVVILPIMVVIFLATSDEPKSSDCGGAGTPGSTIAAAGSLIKPTKSSETTDTSGFGPRGGTMHQGIDRAGPEGTDIFAFTDGRVVAAGPAEGFGNWIILDHQIDGKVYSSVYGHMREAGVLVKVGDQVSAGQRIATIGNAGQSTGAHLHFEIWEGGRLPDGAGTAVDPAPWIDRAAEVGEATPAAPENPSGTPAAPGEGTAGLNASQAALAKQAVAIGESMGVPEQGIVVALSTMSQESTYRMLASSNVPESLSYPHDGVGSDHLSVNQFQQQVTIWGTAEELMNPVTANVKFYNALLKVPGWESMPVTVAAQTVQGSAHPELYADDEPLARQLAAQFKGSGKDLTPQELADIAKVGVATAVVDGGVGVCTPPVSNIGGPQFTPGGPFGANVIAAAARWIGTTYAWGGGDQNGPTKGISDGGGAGDANGDPDKVGFDCSGLTLYAVFQASGGQIQLPHFTGSHGNPGQLYDPRGQDIAFDQKQPGDLIYFGAGGDTHHVGIYYGNENGKDMLLNAPQSGQTVSIMPLDGWAGEEMYVKRFG